MRFVAYGGLFVALAVTVTRCAGYRVAVEGRQGSTRDSSPVDLTSGAAEPLFDDDFRGAEVRNVVVLIADGMGFSHILAARSELGGLNRRLGFERMPVTGWLTTWEADSLIPDSASTATAMVTGFKTARGYLSMDREGRPLRTVLEAAAERGMAAGLVTDSYLWDATVAAFAVHAERRDYPEIAAQMSRSGAEVLFGEACRRCFDDDEWTRVLAGLGSGGYTVLSSWEAAAGLVPGGKVAGLFGNRAVADRELSPNLEQLAAFSLERLAADPDGFLLVVETEETDTASHRHELRRMVEGIGALDQAAAVVLDFARRDRSTLVLLTADHETGGLSLLSGDQGEKLGIRWSTSGHTGLPVPLFAYGPGAESFAGARDNTDVARILARLLGLEMGKP